MRAHRINNVLFLLLTVITGTLAFAPLRDLVRFGRPSEHYSHIPLIPVVSAFLLVRAWRKGFPASRPNRSLGAALLGTGGGLFILGAIVHADFQERAAIASLASMFVLAGSCLLLFGLSAFKKASFAIGFLAFMIPLPAVVMKGVIAALVTASTGVTSFLLRALGVPFVQMEAYFFLPIFDIEVAPQCSGIRSSIALVITAVLAGHLLLDKFWKKLIFVLAVFPVTVIKNGVRIVSLYLLSVFVDMSIIDGGFLHKSGGFIFFGLGLFIMGLILGLLMLPVSPQKIVDKGKNFIDNTKRKMLARKRRI